ncbi:MAG: thiamine-binding protein [Chlorobiales bacterium]|nr:thiamine-binding protein [Chlorobiales bacterium]
MYTVIRIDDRRGRDFGIGDKIASVERRKG